MEDRGACVVWANRVPAGKGLPTAYNTNAMMDVVGSGSAKIVREGAEKRNLLKDYLMFIGKNPPKFEAITIMTDMENTGEEAVVHYEPIRILPDSVPG